jgi:ribonuclease HI
VRQLNGEYRCKEKTLKIFYNAVVDLAEGLDYFEIRHIPRAENKRADWLANHAMDLQESHGFNEIQTELY